MEQEINTCCVKPLIILDLSVFGTRVALWYHFLLCFLSTLYLSTYNSCFLFVHLPLPLNSKFLESKEYSPLFYLQNTAYFPEAKYTLKICLLDVAFINKSCYFMMCFNSPKTLMVPHRLKRKAGGGLQGWPLSGHSNHILPHLSLFPHSVPKSSNHYFQKFP